MHLHIVWFARQRRRQWRQQRRHAMPCPACCYCCWCCCCYYVLPAQCNTIEAAPTVLCVCLSLCLSLWLSPSPCLALPVVVLNSQYNLYILSWLATPRLALVIYLREFVCNLHGQIATYLPLQLVQIVLPTFGRTHELPALAASANCVAYFRAQA